MRLAVAALAGLAVSACMTGPHYNNLKTGMSKAQVMKAMDGCPSTTTAKGAYEAVSYARRMPNFFQWGPKDYAFIFKDGVLVEFGEGAAREQVVSGEPRLVLAPPAKPVS